ncbi:MAG: BREX-1 system adenine-specific DNA-methyltransferase PglX, partial [Eubacteriales bacterium]|nr:BREX-1 system adenine-specific DNA-methyltransferase PglX [Eubacteriales bacterium]
FAALKKNVKITKDNIPAATQLFTPDWIVRYMVENSLGRTYIQYKLVVSGEWSEDSEEKRVAREKEIAESLGWKYYLPEAKQTEEVRKQLNQLNPDTFDPKDLRLLDPCAGSGHILAYMFDVMVTIYQDYGYTTREAAASIVSQNLYGLDIDTRAAQLAYFTVMMKARQYDRRFFSRGIQPHVHAITESNHVGEFARNHFAPDNPSVKEAFDTILEELRDAKEYGSILTVTPQDWEALESNLEELEHSTVHVDGKRIRNLLQTAETLSQKYDVVVTNPPYMGASNMNPKLNDFIKKNYADYKSDFFSAFVIHCSEMTKETGYCGFLTPYVWMFIQSYEKMREYLYNQTTIETLIQFEYSAFEEATVPICTFAFRNTPMKKKGCYLRLVDFRGGMEVQRIKTLEGIENPNCGYYYEQSTDNFTKIPGSPVAYWVGDDGLKAFDAPHFSERFVSGGRNKTHNNEKYVRCWWEIANNSTTWEPYSNGGEYRKWYGNNIDVVDWSETAREYYASHGGLLREEYWNVPAITWNDITSGAASYRLKPVESKFSSVSPTLIGYSKEYDYNMLSFLNSKVCEWMNQITNPTLHTLVGNILSLPDKIGDIDNSILSLASIDLSRADWDSYETSWDFKTHPLISRQCLAVSDQSSPNELTTNHYSLATNDHYPLNTTLAERYESWKQTCNQRFKQLQQNEEELNRIFIDIYGLQEELTPEVADKDVTVHCIFDTKEDIPESLQGSNYVRTKRDEIVSLISYAVGCMLGRYSLESEG